jgi:hypothetical protein
LQVSERRDRSSSINLHFLAAKLIDVSAALPGATATQPGDDEAIVSREDVDDLARAEATALAVLAPHRSSIAWLWHEEPERSARSLSRDQNTRADVNKTSGGGCKNGGKFKISVDQIAPSAYTEPSLLDQ